MNFTNFRQKYIMTSIMVEVLDQVVTKNIVNLLQYCILYFKFSESEVGYTFCFISIHLLLESQQFQ